MSTITKDEEQEWDIIGFRHFSDVANEYFPEYHTSDAACKRMRTDIENDEKLFSEMRESHYTHKTSLLSPKQQRILFMTWGPPKIRIHYHIDGKTI